MRAAGPFFACALNSFFFSLFFSRNVLGPECAELVFTRPAPARRGAGRPHKTDDIFSASRTRRGGHGPRASATPPVACPPGGRPSAGSGGAGAKTRRRPKKHDLTMFYAHPKRRRRARIKRLDEQVRTKLNVRCVRVMSSLCRVFVLFRLVFRVLSHATGSIE